MISELEIALNDPKNDGLSVEKIEIEPIHRLIGAKVAHIRETIGMNQSELGKRVGLSRASIANIEGGRQRLMLHHVEELALIFGMSVQHFMRGIWWHDGRKNTARNTKK